MIYKEDYEFKIGKSIKLIEGDDITVFSSGASVHESISAAKTLDQKNISCAVINMHTIKPIDKLSLNEACKKSKLIVTVEEHNIIGGLGSAVADEISTIDIKPKLLRIGINDTYSKGGSYNFLKEKHGLTSAKIVETILKNL